MVVLSQITSLFPEFLHLGVVSGWHRPYALAQSFVPFSIFLQALLDLLPVEFERRSAPFGWRQGLGGRHIAQIINGGRQADILSRCVTLFQDFLDLRDSLRTQMAFAL